MGLSLFLALRWSSRVDWPVGVRKALANAPRWVRASWWSVVFGVYFGVFAWIGFHTWASAVTLIVAGVLLGVALGPVVMWSELWGRRKLARRLAFLGDLDVLRDVRVEVDAGRVPTEDPTRRELGRRYARWRYDQRILSRVLAASWAVLCLLLVLVLILGGTSSPDLWSLVWFAASGAWWGYDAGIRMPRYRRVLRVLGLDDTVWFATHPCARNIGNVTG